MFVLYILYLVARERMDGWQNPMRWPIKNEQQIRALYFILFIVSFRCRLIVSGSSSCHCALGSDDTDNTIMRLVLIYGDCCLFDKPVAAALTSSYVDDIIYCTVGLYSAAQWQFLFGEGSSYYLFSKSSHLFLIMTPVPVPVLLQYVVVFFCCCCCCCCCLFLLSQQNHDNSTRLNSPQYIIQWLNRIRRND